MQIVNEAEMLAAARDSHPREACGLVYGDRAYVVPNVAHKGTTFFIMDLEEQRRLWNEYGRPDAVWHSHPNDDPNPSHSDLEYHPAWARMLIVAGGKVHDHGYPTGS